MKHLAAICPNEVGQKALAKRLLSELVDIRSAVIKESQATVDDWASRLGPQTLHPGTTNLAHYLALRRHDLSDLQESCRHLG